jgi:hypothetical protein
LSAAAAEGLKKIRGCLNLNGLNDIFDSAAKSLGDRRRLLELNGLDQLSDAAAEAIHTSHLLFIPI